MTGSEQIKRVNVRYHDACAACYDQKWGIDYTVSAQRRVVGKLAKALGTPPGRFDRGLEIGAGTGYFTLNLLRAGVIEKAVATDISQNMLATLTASAERLGLEVSTQVCDAAALPFPDESFDLVFGHAVLHHLPDIDAALREFARVLRPGGRIAFCGEPSSAGDRLANLPKHTAALVAPLWRLAVGASSAPGEDNGAHHELERHVDVHTFSSSELRALFERSGFEDARVRGEELLANLFGWLNRSLEASARDDEIPWAWRQYAYHGYLALERVDSALLEPRLPAMLFYNLLVSARAP